MNVPSAPAGNKKSLPWEAFLWFKWTLCTGSTYVVFIISIAAFKTIAFIRSSWKGGCCKPIAIV